MLDTSKAVQTRDGRPAKIISSCLSGKYPIGVLVKNPDGTETFDCVDRNGKAWDQEGPLDSDIINVPETKTSYSRVYASTRGTIGLEVSGILSPDIATARNRSPSARKLVGFIKMTVVQGEHPKAEFVPA
ncbi:hypothetical protein [Sphingomonas melonis]|uniref:hypothetical protein n=1 Tax=Sphingomonas melonis TaxID=152682 RepID=UPI0035C7FF0E